MLNLFVVVLAIYGINIADSTPYSQGTSSYAESTAFATASASAKASSSATGSSSAIASSSAKASSQATDCNNGPTTKCGKNQVYDLCPSSCPPRTCATKDIQFSCITPLEPGDPKCPAPKCRCADNFYSNDKGECVPKEQCPKTCGYNEIYYSCPKPACGNQTCEDIGKVYPCPLVPPNYPCVGECRCKPGYYKNKLGQCICEEECKKSIQCGKNKVYDVCPPTCPPRTCATKDIAFRCKEPLKPGDPKCPAPKCRCANNYYSNDQGECVLKEDCPPSCGTNEVVSTCANSPCIKTCATKDLNYQCKPYPPGCKSGCVCADGYFRDENGRCVKEDECPSTTPPLNCGTNEVYYSCPEPLCFNQTCNNAGKIFNCPEIPADYDCVPECRCKEGYYRNKIGQCITEEECKKCPGEYEYFSCDNACDNECDKLSKQSHKNCPIVNIVCNRMCYCLEGYARDAKNNCIPISKCPATETCGFNKIYYPCPVPTCANQTCDNIGKRFNCPLIPADYPCVGVCRCKPGYYENKLGQCISEDECKKAKQCGKNEVYDVCPSSCPLRTCATKDIQFDCVKPLEPGDPKCPAPECRCADNYYRNDQNECVPKEECPTLNCDTNEVYYSCPKPVCFNQTCDNIGKDFFCPYFANYTCKPECRCKEGYYRNKIGNCITEEECKMCPGKHEFFSCGGACDNICDRLSRWNQTNCPIINIVCNRMCYCEDGYARDADNNCIPISQCPPECKVDEEYSNCPKKVCRAKTCNDLGYPLPCLQLPERNNTDCGKPGCICEQGLVRNKTGTCIPAFDCPSCGGDKNAISGCGTFCTTCENYKDKSRACPDVCDINGCDCRPGYVYDRKAEKCVLPENCSTTPKNPDEDCNKCKKNEEYSTCPGKVCREQSCNDLGFELPCNENNNNSTECGKPACICQDGFVRNKDGECIPKRDCPSCGGDSNAWSGCGTFCNRCEKNYPCPRICKPNSCDCRPGYVYNDIKDKCVLPTECPKTCGKNETFEECPNRVCQPKTCKDVGYPLPCFETDIQQIPCGKPDCICEIGFVRNDKGVCIPSRDCPSCAGDKNAWSGCGTYCERCNNYKSKNRACILLCRINSCDCRPGYVYDQIKKKCVLPEQCPCGSNEVRSKCGNNKCINEYCTQGDETTKCTFNHDLCKPGCLCAKGYLRAENGTCIREDKCPTKCGPFEDYSSCANAGCDKRNCSQLTEPALCIDILPEFCKGACVCKSGYLRTSDGKCVPELECPSKDVCPKPHQHFDTCPPACPARKCGIDDRLTLCKPTPVGGCNKPACRCDEGYYMTPFGDCVKFEDCPPTCPTNEVLSECGNNGCLSTCAQPDLQTYCDPNPDFCKPGCVCTEGYLRNNKGVCVPRDQCPPNCGDNEVYDECPSSCPVRTCEAKDRLQKCKAPLKPGDPKCPRPACRCADGFYRNSDGKCVTKQECPVTQPTCNTDEIYEPCSSFCDQTCENIDKPTSCMKKSAGDDCTGECRCKPGFYRNKVNRCISEEDCRKCKGPFEYFDCDNACDNVCSTLSVQNHTSCPIFSFVCNKMCYCEEGYARDSNNICIPISKCPPECKVNEEFSDCPNGQCREKTCEDVGVKLPCYTEKKFRPCGEPGCVCKDGFVRNNKGECIPRESCPPKNKCGPNQIFEECPSTCPPRTCASKDAAFKCAEPLKPGNPNCPPPGCSCLGGFYSNDNGDCVTKEECPKCKKNEEYSTCPGQVCREQSCNDLGFELPCNGNNNNSTECGKPACICQDGFVRNKDGECIPKRDCPSCGGDSNAWSGCGTFCNRCKKNYPCPKICKPNACDCRPGYVYNDIKDKCVLPTECPKTCGKNETFQECPNRVCEPKTCKDVGYPLPCFQTDIQQIPCGKPDCICETGFVRNDKGVCIPSRDCPSCGGDKNAWSGCGTYCERCNNYKSKNRACILLCRINSCDCRPGYVYDQIKEKCVLREQCPCGSNEVRSNCGNNECINEYCTQGGENTKCTFNHDLCKPGCLCAKGYLRAENGTCIREDKCPPKCGPFEDYSSCANAGCDKRNCSQVTEPALCIDILPEFCEGACVCKSGYLRTSNGKCVPESECPSKDVCPKPHQYFDKCPPACPARQCGVVCKPTPGEGCNEPICRCEQGFYMTPFGDCVKFEDCPPTSCPTNEVLSKCGNNGCLSTCAEPERITYCDYDPSTCKPGCVCADGYLRNNKNVCVPRDQCPPNCGDNEVYDECPSSCPVRTCEAKDRLQKCKAPLKPGDPKCPRPACRCADGFYRNSDGKCVTKQECPSTCPKNEVLSDCGNNGCLSTCAQPNLITYCSYDPSTCKPGCVCADGYLRNNKNVCVPRDKCPPEPSQCKCNEVPSDCANNICLPDCADPKRNLYCKPNPANCKPGCICADGYLRNNSGDCVPKNECPSC